MSEYEGEKGEPIELSDYLRVLRERWWIIAAALLIVLAVTLAVSFNTTPQYRAFARLLYQKNNLEQALFGAQVFTATNQDREVQTGAVLVELEPLAREVADKINSSRSPSELMGMVRVETQSTTNVVDIYAEGPSPDECAAVANQFAEQFVLFRQNTDRASVAGARQLVKEELDSLSAIDVTSQYGLMLQEKYESLRIIEEMQNGGFIIVQRATVPTKAFAPQTTRNAIIAVVVGLLVGVGLAFLADRLDTRIRDEKDLEKELGAPVLASVPLMGGRWRDRKKETDSADAIGFHKRPAILEAFRTLRSNLQYFTLEKEQSVWLITSGAPQEGKTTTTINLGLSLALSGKRVIVVEADLRRPMVNEYLGLNRAPGLSNLLAGGKKLEDVLQVVKADEFMLDDENPRSPEAKRRLLERNLCAISSGPLPPNPAELLASSRMAKVIKELTAMADCLLIDTPPVLAVSDALALARHVDGVIIVSRLDSTSREELREVRDIFERAGTRIIGAVAAGKERSPAYYRKQGYGYGYGYGYGSDY
ncbi:MAG: AAA family ATPase [Thermoleophilia bacterium]|nr:AAA family ATPase [Thermoleophilia bacterium]